MGFSDIGIKLTNIEDLQNHVEKNPNMKRLVWIYAEWCGHCIHFLPTWREIISSSNGDVEFLVIDGSNIQLKTVNGYPRILGFPTIWMFEMGSKNPIEYRGARTARDIQSKLNSLNK